MIGFAGIPYETVVSMLVHVVAAGAVTIHVLRRNLEVRAAVGWIGLAWLSPLLGSAAYYVLGINRIYRRAARRRKRRGPAPGVSATSVGTNTARPTTKNQPT